MSLFTYFRLINSNYSLLTHFFFYVADSSIFVLRFEQVEAERSRVSRRTSSSWEEDSEMKGLEYAICFYIE